MNKLALVHAILDYMLTYCTPKVAIHCELANQLHCQYKPFSSQCKSGNVILTVESHHKIDEYYAVKHCNDNDIDINNFIELHCIDYYENLQQCMIHVDSILSIYSGTRMDSICFDVTGLVMSSPTNLHVVK